MSYPLQLSARYQFTVYPTRDAAVAAGIDPGAFNPLLPIKAYSCPPGMYQIADTGSPATGYLDSIFIPPAQAGYNLPGAEPYPPYTVTPCIVNEFYLSSSLGSVDVSAQVCNLADAQALMAVLQPLFPSGQLGLIEDFAEGSGAVYYSYPSGETRRCWLFTLNGIPENSWNAQVFLAAERAKGLGYPGAWSLVGGAPSWIFGSPITQAPPNAVTFPEPILLQPGEALGPPSGVFPEAGQLLVYNKSSQLASLYPQVQTLYAEILALGGNIPVPPES